LEREQNPQVLPNAVERTPAPTAVAEFDSPVAFAQAEFAAAMAEDAAAMAEEIPLGATAPGFEAIARQDWSPSLERLPSLLDRGPSVEQFRSLRSRLFEMRDMRPLKSVLISSGLPQEGKSFISANLAISLARHRNNRVLLIDGDMRRYTMHEMLGTSPSPGLADYLAGNATMEEILQRGGSVGGAQGVTAANRAILGNLAFIPGGNGGDRAADLSGSVRFGELLAAVGPMFDWVIIDSSPVLPVSDAVNLARSCDGVLLVARAGVTKYPVAQRAASELRAAHILGFVLNAVHEAPHTGSYYGYDSGTK
jgi:capsular exopolysaccharide synthesis family protein